MPIYRVHVTHGNGKVHDYDAHVGGGLLSAEAVADHLNNTGHFDKHKPKEIVVDPEPLSQAEVGQGINEILNKQGVAVPQKIAPSYRVAKVGDTKKMAQPVTAAPEEPAPAHEVDELDLPVETEILKTP